MQAMRNAVHGLALGVWAVLGVIFSVQSLFNASAVMPVVVFWGWFAAFAALMTYGVTQLKSPLSAFGAHGAALLALNLVPAVFPFVIVRVGYDLLRGCGLPF